MHMLAETQMQKHNATQHISFFVKKQHANFTKKRYKSRHNLTTLNNIYTTSHNFVTTLHTCTQLYMHKTLQQKYKTIHNSVHLYNFTELYNTIHNFTKQYCKHPHNFTTLVQQSLHLFSFTKMLQVFAHFYTIVHNSTQLHKTLETHKTSKKTAYTKKKTTLYNTLHTFLQKVLQTSRQLYKTSYNTLRNLYTTSHTIYTTLCKTLAITTLQPCTNFYATSQHFTTLDKLVRSFTPLHTIVHICTQLKHFSQNYTQLHTTIQHSSKL